MNENGIKKKTETSTFQFHDYAFAILILLPLLFSSCNSTGLNSGELYADETLSLGTSEDRDGSRDPYLCNPDSVEATTWFWEHPPGEDAVWIDIEKAETSDPFLCDPESVEATWFWERPLRKDAVLVKRERDKLPSGFLYFQSISVEESLPRD